MSVDGELDETQRTRRSRGRTLFVIARPTKSVVAIQPLDMLGALTLSKRLDCFVASLLAMTVHLSRNAGIKPLRELRVLRVSKSDLIT
jgi:hypothetical protein